MGSSSFKMEGMSGEWAFMLFLGFLLATAIVLLWRLTTHTQSAPAANLLLQQQIEALREQVSASLGQNAGLLQKQTADRNNPEIQEHWAIIDQETTRMDQLISDLLAFARVTRAEMQRQHINMKQLVESTAKEFSLETQGRDIRWQIGSLPEVIGDPSLLRQALANLLENALKFTRTRARAEIKVDALLPRAEEKDATFYVQDNGCGIEPAILDMIFDPFFTTKEVGKGTGQGLAISRSIVVDRHGGALEVNSIVGTGTRFTIRLPVTPL